MSTQLFLIAVSVGAAAIGVFAAAFPIRLLASKGAVASPAAVVWVREVGVTIFSQAVMAFLLADQPDSPAVRAFFIGSAVLQFGLFPIEIAAYKAGTLVRVSGIVPNSVLHLALGATFTVLAFR